MNPNSRHCVYRVYDADDRLLYIGCTRDIGARFQVHYSSWDNPASAVITLRGVRHTEEWHPCLADARAAEKAAIGAEAPLCNLHHQRERVTPQARAIRLAEYIEASRGPTSPFLEALADTG